MMNLEKMISKRLLQEVFTAYDTLQEVFTAGVPQLVQENEILKSMLTNLSEFQLYNEKFMR